LERVGIGRLIDLPEHGVERPAGLRLGQLGGQSLESLGQDLERVGVARLADLLEEWGEGLLCLRLGQLGRQRFEFCH